MDLQKLNPWNWFKHEETQAHSGGQIPIKRTSGELDLTTTNQGFGPVQQLHQQIDRLFDDAFRGFGLPSVRSALFEPGGGWGTTAFRPSLNVSSDNASYQISLEAPGMTEADLSIEVKDDILTIQGQKQEEKESKDRHFYRVERSYGHFQRTLALPDDAVADEIKATMKDGVLNLLIPRREASDAEVKKITINH